MKLTVISDTHGEHEKLGVLSGDVLIHCGDMFNLFGGNGHELELERMDHWFGRQEFELILCIGGNHDFPLQEREGRPGKPFRHAVYLEGSSHEYRGLRFYGAPWVPELRGQAFYQDDSGLGEKWAQIPADTDVLITHTPPAGIRDVSSRGLELGCPQLAGVVGAVAPRLHCFGHVHASSGVSRTARTIFVNAALVDSQYQLCRDAYNIALDPVDA